MINIEVNAAHLRSKDQLPFMNACHRSVEKIADSAPSDNNVRLFVTEDDDDNYTVQLQVVSNELAINSEKTARSPFMALEASMKETLDRIKRWSASRDTDHL